MADENEDNVPQQVNTNNAISGGTLPIRQTNTTTKSAVQFNVRYCQKFSSFFLHFGLFHEKQTCFIHIFILFFNFVKCFFMKNFLLSFIFASKVRCYIEKLIFVQF